MFSLFVLLKKEAEAVQECGHIVRLAVIADEDSLSLPSEPIFADILISLGDIHPATIERAADCFMPERVLAVRGNHDSLCVPLPRWVEFMHGRTVEAFGFRFGGIDGCWRYKKTGSFLFTQEEARTVMQTIPPVDVLISHNSPASYHERDRGSHQGFEAITEYIDRYTPTLVLHGHQHINAQIRRGTTLIAGVWGWVMFELKGSRESGLSITSLISNMV